MQDLGDIASTMPPAPAAASPWAQRRTLIVACSAVSLVIATMAALYTALPRIVVDTGAGQTQAAWIIDSYTLALACLVLPAGAIGDRYGRRLVLILGLIVFCAASAVCLATLDAEVLIAARTVAGIGAALVMPSTLSLLTAGFPPDAVGRAIGYWAGCAGTGGLLGLVGSGVLLQWWSWQSIFVVMTVSAVVLIAAACTVPESRSADRQRFDLPGTLTIVVAIAAFVAALIEVAERDWTDPYILTGFAVAAAAAALFVIVELRVRSPLLDLRLFARRQFAGGAASVTVQFLATFGMFLVTVQYLQLVLGYSPLKSALACLPMGAPLVVLSQFTPGLAARYGLRLLTVTGLAVIAGAMLLLSHVTPEAGYPGILIPLLLMSIGLGLTAAPATAAIMNGSPADKHGVAAAVNDATREIGAAIGIALAGTVLASGYRSAIDPVLPRIPEPAREPLAHSLAATAQLAEQAGPQAQPLLDLARDAFVHGVQNTSLLLAGICFTAAVALAILAPGRQRPSDPDL
ncbi:MFS transporter [Nocardia sp. NPDC024068]|uniref:MFS transporter n=1 Tax=Nocardia sp. NPDC024068 TaxID=3157197 RepID=UPI0033FB5811